MVEGAAAAWADAMRGQKRKVACAPCVEPDESLRGLFRHQPRNVGSRNGPAQRSPTGNFKNPWHKPQAATHQAPPPNRTASAAVPTGSVTELPPATSAIRLHHLARKLLVQFTASLSDSGAVDLGTTCTAPLLGSSSGGEVFNPTKWHVWSPSGIVVYKVHTGSPDRPFDLHPSEPLCLTATNWAGGNGLRRSARLPPISWHSLLRGAKRASEVSDRRS
jgi:hypothetical protein